MPPYKAAYCWHRLPPYTIESVHGKWEPAPNQVVNNQQVYRSIDSWNVNKAWDAAKITFKGVIAFSIGIRSYAESNYDYVLVSTLNNDYLANCSLTGDMRNVYNNSEYTKAYTRGKQSPTDYEIVNFSDLNPNQEYYFYVIYQKDNSTHKDDDRGYFYIVDEPYKYPLVGV